MYKFYTTWTESKARETYGYNICTLKECGTNKKIARCGGGGYDMTGAVFGIWLTENFQDRLKLLSEKDNYGLFHQERGSVVDGACGTWKNIAKKIGLEVYQLYIANDKIGSAYLILDTQS